MIRRNPLALLVVLAACSGPPDEPTPADASVEDPCAAVSCSGRGACVVQEDAARCECQTGFHAVGTECIADVPNPCAGVKCWAHASCQVSGSMGRCVCDEGWVAAGSSCVTCDGQSCSGHGVCSLSAGRPGCQCHAGYYADKLECLPYTWRSQASYTSLDLRSVSFDGSGNGWAVGAGGTVRQIAKGGTSWRTQTLPVEAELYAVEALGSGRAWILGATGTVGALFRTDDGGKSWIAESQELGSGLRAVWRVGNEGWAVGASGGALRTRDEGASWAALTTGTDATLRAVHFSDAQHGWAVGWTDDVADQKVILSTVDGGDTWAEQSTRYSLNAVWFLDETVGFVAGFEGTGALGSGVLLRTEDAGASWVKLALPRAAPLQALRFVDSTRGWAVGLDGTVLATIDAGETWSEERSEARSRLNGIWVDGDGLGWAVGAGGEIVTKPRL